MKQIKTYWLPAAVLAGLFVCVARVVAQVTNGDIPIDPAFIPPAIDPVTAPLPNTLVEYWQYAIPVVTPLVIAVLKKIGPKIPRRAMPLISPVLGIVLGIGMQLIMRQHFSWMSATLSGLLGGAGTWLREAVDQNLVQPNTAPETKIAELDAKKAEVEKNPRATT